MLTNSQVSIEGKTIETVHSFDSPDGTEVCCMIVFPNVAAARTYAEAILTAANKIDPAPNARPAHDHQDYNEGGTWPAAHRASS